MDNLPTKKVDSGTGREKTEREQTKNGEAASVSLLANVKVILKKDSCFFVSLRCPARQFDHRCDTLKRPADRRQLD